MYIFFVCVFGCLFFVHCFTKNILKYMCKEYLGKKTVGSKIRIRICMCQYIFILV